MTHIDLLKAFCAVAGITRWACPAAPVSDDAGRDQSHAPHTWQREQQPGQDLWCRGYRQPQRPPNYAPPGNGDDPSGQLADIEADRVHQREVEPPTYRPRRTR